MRQPNGPPPWYKAMASASDQGTNTAEACRNGQLSGSALIMMPAVSARKATLQLAIATSQDTMARAKTTGARITQGSGCWLKIAIIKGTTLKAALRVTG
jgi:hypothetical protein